MSKLASLPVLSTEAKLAGSYYQREMASPSLDGLASLGPDISYIRGNWMGAITGGRDKTKRREQIRETDSGVTARTRTQSAPD